MRNSYPMNKRIRIRTLVALAAQGLALGLLSHPSRADDTEVVASFRVLHQNIFGRDKADCATRYRALARHILAANPPYDIVTLNEHWHSRMGDLVGETCDADILTDALMADGRYRDSEGAVRSKLSYPRGHFYQSNGGNSLLTLHRITRFDSFTFENSNDLPIAGFMRSRVELAPGISVDFWTTHLESGSDNCHEQCHRTQLKQLADYVGGHRSGVPVLIAGDFNVGGPASGDERLAHEADPAGHPYGGNPGYDFMMDYFAQPRDLWLEAHPHARDPDDGYSYDAVTNRLAYDAYRERIDYLLAPEHPAYKSGPYDVRVRQMELVRWRTPEGGEISDHYGVDAQLDVVRVPYELPTAQYGGPEHMIRVHLGGGRE